MSLEVSRDQIAMLQSFFRDRDGNTEIEARIGSYTAPTGKSGRGNFRSGVENIDTFQKIFDYLSSRYGSDAIVENTMDVTVRDVDRRSPDTRYRLIGSKDDIQRYCVDNRMDRFAGRVEVIKKGDKKHIDFEEYGFRITKSDEVPVVPNYREADKSMKSFRMKERYIFKDVLAEMEYHLTLVKESSSSTSSLSKSDVFDSPVYYEVEMEYVGKRMNIGVNVESVVERFLEGISDILMLIQGTPRLIKNSVVRDVLYDYSMMIYRSTGKRIEDKSRMFLGVKPLTLDMNSFVDFTASNPIYTLTEKADGVRAMLYVDSRKDCYLIKDDMSVMMTGMKMPEMENSLFDGEYIEEQDSIYLFDTLFLNSVDIRDKPLIDPAVAKGQKPSSIRSAMYSSRNGPLDLIRSAEYKGALEKANGNSTSFRVYAKTLYMANWNDLKKSARDIWMTRRAEYPYHLDGLIFTPNTRHPKTEMGQRMFDMEGGNKNQYKWKPHKENTIDFLMRIHQEVIEGESRDYIGETIVDKNGVVHSIRHKIATLYVGQQVNRDYVPAKFEVTNYENIGETYLLVDEDGNLLSEQDNSLVRNDTVVECRFRYESSLFEMTGAMADLIKPDIMEASSPLDNVPPEISRMFKWVPIRTRKDKTGAYQNTKKITANNVKTAVNIWNSIVRPITDGMVTGIVEVDTSKEAAYYVADGSHAELSKGMRFYHNRLKESLLTFEFMAGPQSNRPKGMKIMDLGCGRGGDLQKYERGGYSLVMGVDTAVDNIHDPDARNGAYARLESMKEKSVWARKTPVYFFHGDMKTKIDETGSFLLSPERDGEKFKREFVLERMYKQEYFDVISAQFSIHYSFDMMKNFRRCMENIDWNLKKGGFLFITTMNGDSVMRMLMGKNVNESVGATVMENGEEVKLWSITKKYDGYNTTAEIDRISDTASECVGKAIDVYFHTIGKTYTEYLVNPKFLISTLEKYGIYQIDPNELSEAYMDNLGGEFRGLYESFVKKNSQNTMRDDLKPFSFLNRYFIFRRYKSRQELDKEAIPVPVEEEEKPKKKKEDEIKSVKVVAPEKIESLMKASSDIESLASSSTASTKTSAKSSKSAKSADKGKEAAAPSGGEMKFDDDSELSPKYLFKMKVPGVPLVVKSVEHYMLFKKFEKTDSDVGLEVLGSRTAKSAKKVAKENSEKEDPAWNDNKDSYMKEALEIKFKDSDMAGKLKATGDAELIYDESDSHWGIGRGKGKNRVGKMLMEIRKKL